MLDDLVVGFDRALRTLSGLATTSRPVPGANIADAPFAPEERRHAAGLMRVNHTGEICAQALQRAQALAAHDEATRGRLGCRRRARKRITWRGRSSA